MWFFTTVQSAVTCECGRAPSCKSVYLGISKLILYFIFYYIFHVPCFVLFTVYFHTVIFVFRTSIYAVFFKDLPSISQSNVQAVKAEKEE